MGYISNENDIIGLTFKRKQNRTRLIREKRELNVVVVLTVVWY